MTSGFFPDIGEIGTIDAPRNAPAKKAAPKPTELELAQQRADEAEAREREANDALRASVSRQTAPPATRAPADPAPPQPGKMPDPATQPAEFEVWQSMTRDYDRWENRQHVENVRASESSATRSQKVIDAFIERNPKYAPIRSHVFQCYHEAAAELKLTEVPDNTTQLDALAEKKIKALVNTVAAAADLPTGDPNTDDDPPNRTGGLSGGSNAGLGGGAPPAEEDGVVIKSLTDVMKDRQAKSDLF